MKKNLLRMFSLLLLIILFPQLEVHAGLVLDDSQMQMPKTIILSNDSTGFAVNVNKELWGWGNPGWGILPDGYFYRPLFILDNVEKVSAGDQTAMALRTDGGLYIWGSNSYGAFGRGSFENVTSTTPLFVMNDVIDMESGFLFSFAIKSDHSLWVWGYNAYGHLGDGSDSNRNLPIKTLENVKSVYAGTHHAMAIKNDGTLWAWGNNSSGQLGDGTLTDRLSPKMIMSDVASVTLGSEFSLILKQNGDLYAVGTNGNGQLGDGTTTSRQVPFIVMSEVESVQSGTLHSVAVKKDGTLWAWGDNGGGQVGNGTWNDQLVPIEIMSEVASVTTGSNSNFVIKDDGSVWSWGIGFSGILANGSGKSSNVPILVRSPDPRIQVEAFVSRFYELVLNRTTDPWGLNDWTTKLLNGERSGADVAYGFVFSNEFKNRGLSDEQYVNIMYEAFFNRSADAGGYANWMDALSKGMSRYYVLRGFTDSQEFKDLASSYGINPGSLVLSQPADLYPDITAFVTRFYKETLNRMPDEGGLNDWVGKLQQKSRSGADVANGFIFSDEFKAKNLNNDLFVKTLYKAFFGREADTGGYNDWMNRLASGQTREQVLKGFLGSAEFRDLCTKYGINPGI